MSAAPRLNKNERDTWKENMKQRHKLGRGKKKKLDRMSNLHQSNSCKIEIVLWRW